VLTRTTGTPLATLPDGTNRLVCFLERLRDYGMLTPWHEPTPEQAADARALAGRMIRDERGRRAAEQRRFERCGRLLGLGERDGPAGHLAAEG
jgi:hypothetical protein